MKFGCCANLQDVPILESCGYDYVELPVAVVCPHKGDKEYAKISRQIKSFGIKPEVFNCFIPTDMKIIGTQIEQRQRMQYVEIAVHRVAELGGKLIVFGSGGARSVPPGLPYTEASKQLERFLIKVADHAAENGITIVIEPLRKKETNMINTIEEALNLVKKIGRQEIKILADLYHVVQEKEPFFHLMDAKDYLAHIHVADGDNRSYPGSNDYDFIEFFSYLKMIKYEQRISIECEWSNLAKEAPKALKFLHKACGN